MSRDTSSLDPMWQGAKQARGSTLVRAAVAVGGGVARRVAPHVLRFVAAQQPEVELRWGAEAIRVARDGVRRARRGGDGWGDNPRRNYNDAVQRQQERGAAGAGGVAPVGSDDGAEADSGGDVARKGADPRPTNAAAAAADPGAHGDAAGAGAAAAAPAAPDFSLGALLAEVDRKMGKGAPEGAAIAHETDAIQAHVGALRGLLQTLDDVSDWDLLETVDEDLYQLHRALEYKLRQHKSSEAKARLNTLFR